MIRFGIIGTNFITHSFLEAIHEVEGATVAAVYSRTAERATEFAKECGIVHTFTSLEDMAMSDVIDAVYIASPNSLHAEQSILFMRHGKHVLCEKPFASNVDEVKLMLETARQHDVVLLEALRNLFMPNFQILRQTLPRVGPVRRVILNKSQYSSRYDLYKRGDNPNTFNPMFSNGSLMDLGVYCLGPALKLFGRPDAVQANAVKLDSGVDGSGSAILSYDGMDIIVLHSKIHGTDAPSEIIGEAGRIVIDDIASLDRLTFVGRDGTTVELGSEQASHMTYEIQTFVNMIEAGERETEIHSFDDMFLLADVMTDIRRRIDVRYPADV
ncbi:Gfo/Idh/MocA family oxidoreductase [Exiguobacterium sp. SH1S21]|uniref:Gfo/Idh/MocA family protein n=1 Tax=Exiguobacterium sp. SH1S21 TaxID=2510953 RepID=UPI00103DB10D|nr:Gfo/Idh/MocA family oxidoreductase [Exiguobacterium sp. SH1S21]TCI54132.1 Gfo/Idh/MocA family oxidoreductase [Exiguobacterium sp. SH1S21]